MAYDVKITDSALLDAEQYVNYIRFEKRDPEAAEIWFHGLVSAMFSLAQLPSRYALIPEAEEFSFELRQLIFHSHRIIYRIDDARKTVIVIRVYHGSRRRLRRKDFEDKTSSI